MRRYCEIRRRGKDDAELERKHPELRRRAEDRRSERVSVVADLLKDAERRGLPAPDAAEVLARVDALERQCSPRHPRQRVLLWLTDQPPFFCAATTISSVEGGDEERAEP